MKIQLLLLIVIGFAFAGVDLDFDVECECEDYKVKANCEDDDECVWENNACREEECEDLKQSDCLLIVGCKWESGTCKDYDAKCSEFTTEMECDIADNNCAWNAGCKEFTKCSDYAPGTTGCLEKSPDEDTICVLNAAGNKCEDMPSSCSSYTVQQRCTISDKGFCVWKSGKCEDIDSCSDADGLQSYCPLTSCRYANNKCVPTTCADYTTSSTCTYVIDIDHEGGTLCEWDSSKSTCNEADNTEHLSSSTCSKNTAYTHAWDGNSCESCESGSKILLSIALAALIFIA